jgi:hypothetical protein
MASHESKTSYDRTGAKTSVERRGNVRRITHAVFNARFDAAQVMGGGRDISRSGAYFMTSDEVKLEVSFAANGRDLSIPAKIVRIEPISPGTLGIAVQFDRRLHEHELP